MDGNSSMINFLSFFIRWEVLVVEVLDNALTS